MQEEAPEDQGGEPSPTPEPGGDQPCQDRVDRHGPGDRDAVSGGEVARGAEGQDEQQHARHQEPVHARDVDLPGRGRGGVADRHPRQVAQPDGLAGEREHARDHRLAGDDGRRGGEADQRQQRPIGREMVEGVLKGGGVAQDQSTLAEIVEQQPGQDEAEPGEADRRGAEMAHVGVERLRPGDAEHDGTQRHEGLPAGVPEQAQGVGRVERGEHARALDDLERGRAGPRSRTRPA